MSATLTPAMFLLLAFCVSVEIARELCFKLAANSSAGEGGGMRFMQGLFSRPFLWLGLFCWAVEMVAWINVLQHIPLGIAFPIATLPYCGIPLASRFLFNEPLGARKLLGIALIMLGVVCVGLTGV